METLTFGLVEVIFITIERVLEMKTLVNKYAVVLICLVIIALVIFESAKKVKRARKK